MKDARLVTVSIGKSSLKCKCKKNNGGTNFTNLKQKKHRKMKKMEVPSLEG